MYPSETMLNGSLHARRSTGVNCSVPPPLPFLRRATAVGCTEMFRLQHNNLIIFVRVYIYISLFDTCTQWGSRGVGLHPCAQATSNNIVTFHFNIFMYHLVAKHIASLYRQYSYRNNFGELSRVSPRVCSGNSPGKT